MKFTKLVAGGITFFLFSLIAIADGTENLGPPSIGIADGTNVIVAGVGLCDQCTDPAPNPGTIDVTIPDGASIQQVLLYWHGANFDGDAVTGDTALVSAGGPPQAVAGTLIGGPTNFFSNVFDLTRRADITGLGLIGPGSNTLTIETSFVQANLGAGLLVIIDDGSAPSAIELRDGQDLAFVNFGGSLQVTVPQTYNFSAASDDRNAEIAIISGSAEISRNDIIRVMTGGLTTDFNNLLDGTDGSQFDALSLPILIPTGATSLTVELISGPDAPADSLSWLASALTIEPPETPGTVSIGDRVWEDSDRDGQQDCVDGGANDPANPADGVIGNTGDSGPECDSGVPNVTVELYSGPDCTVPAGPSTTTNADGFYLFSDLAPGEYCVRFDKNSVDPDFCEALVDDMLVNLGDVQFTAQNAGAEDVSDSDADTMTGLTESVDVPTGADLTIDAGLFCPAKLGNLVFEDTSSDGIQDPGEPGVGGVQVELVDCGPDGVAGTPDDEPTGETRITDETGMYMFGGEPGFDLLPGNYFVTFNPATIPSGFDFTLPKAGGSDTVDSDCLAPEGRTACADVSSSRAVNLDRDCGLVPPPPSNCNLELDKTCRIEAPPSPPFDKCNGKLQQFSVAWTGGPITVTGAGVVDLPVANGEIVTFVGPFDQNDVVINLSGAANGTSVFHMSCSDDDFNSPDDCGKAAGNGKGDSGINDWTLEGFVDAEGRVLNCGGSGDGEPFAQNCEFTKSPSPSCETLDKPDTLTWRYDGGGSAAGGCDGSSFATAVNSDGKMHEDFMCAGSVDPNQEITVVDKDGVSQLVGPGESFTVSRDATEELSLIQDGGASQQDLEFHTSCSQPIAVGLTAGALTLSALDGITGGADVTYQYVVSNNGDPLSNVEVTDDRLGDIGSVSTLGTGQSASFTATTTITETTANIGTASGTLADGSMCSPAAATDEVIVQALEPSCAVSAVFKELKEDKIKFTVTNTSQIRATLDTFVLDYPAGHDAIKEVKLDGAIYKADDSSLVVGPGVVIDSDDWTQSDISKRQLEPGESRTLEVPFTEKQKDTDSADYAGDISFVEGCSSAL